jgi:hypothetical protein
MKEWFNKNISNITYYVLTVILSLILLLFYHAYTHSLIKSIYEGNAHPLLNKVIESQQAFPVSYYYNMADRLFYIFLICMIVFLISLRLRILKVIIINIVVCFLLIEGIMSLMLTFPYLSRLGLHKVIKKLYIEKYRNIISLEQECAHYDPGLTYTLKPGIFYFSNSEYKNIFKVNRLGVRDDEDSLSEPDIVVLGDSMAMGIGVEQDETWANIVEKKSGLKVLNTAISSYGTVRQMLMLDRVDTSNLKYLIIHYIDNDYTENKAFYDGSFKISSEREYKAGIADYKSYKRYYLGKNLITVLQGSHNETEDRKNEALYFINALMTAGRVDLSHKKIVVIGSHSFILKLQDLLKNSKYPANIKSMILIDTSPILDDTCHYILDHHMSANGHKRIAEKVLNIVNTE